MILFRQSVLVVLSCTDPLRLVSQAVLVVIHGLTLFVLFGLGS